MRRIQQKCWKCKKAIGGCSWADSGTPVKNWVAEKTVIVESQGNIESYMIISCPEFEKDDPIERLNMIKLAKKLIGEV